MKKITFYDLYFKVRFLLMLFLLLLLGNNTFAQNFSWPTSQTSNRSGLGITWVNNPKLTYDNRLNVVPRTLVSKATSTTSETIKSSVIAPASCDALLERVYANGQVEGPGLLGGVDNGPQGADGDPSTFSTIRTGLSVLFIGTQWQRLTWAEIIPKGTPVTVKLGLENGLLAVGQTISVVGTNGGIDIGSLQVVTGSLVSLLPGQNSFEYTFVPSGSQDYDGIRIELGAAVGLGLNANVYDAYYKKEVSTTTTCGGDIEDVLSGVKKSVVQAVTGLVSVQNPWNIADGDVNTYAAMHNTVGLLAASELTAVFRTPSTVNDTLRITISRQTGLLDLAVLNGFAIQLYLGDNAVGGPIANGSSLLNLRLLSGTTRAMITVKPQTQPYDRVKISIGGVADLLGEVDIHTIDRVTNTKIIGGNDDNEITVCPGSPISLVVPATECATYEWYSAPTGGTALATGESYTLPAILTPGPHKYYIQPIRYGCPVFERGEVTVNVSSAPNTPTLTTAGTQSFCSTAAPTFASILFNDTDIVWYTDSTRATAIASTTALTSGTYYAVIKDPTTGCESATGLLVTVVVTTPGTPTLTTAGTQSFCSTAAPTFASILFNDTDIVWYTDSTRATAIASTTALTSGTYYAVIKDPTTGCESVTGLLVTVVVTTPGTPTLTTAGTQSFCSTAAPTFASILFNDTDIVWYTDSTRATAIASTTALTSGTYYAVIKDPTTGCESATGLLVTVVVTTPGTPTLTTAGTQSFCSTAAPTFASILFNDTDIVWYTDSTRATAIASTTALTSGTYYAVIKDPTTGCESVTGLLVTVVVTTPGTPTLTTAGTQSFCSTAAPTFASILFNDTDIVWYTDSTRATAIASTTALTSGTYYAVIKDPTTGCESVTGLLVTVVVTTPGTPTLTTAGTQSFCSTAAPTFASILFNDTDIVWYTDSTRATAIASTTALTSGTYYAVIKDPTTGCESVTGLLVTVVVTTPGTPTLTTAGTQSFCSTAAPTFASILFNDTDIVWYTDSTRATAIASTTALTSGTYYAVIKDPTTGCESATGLLVTVVVTTPGTPTLTTAGTQSFCSTAAPTFASILFNDTDIVWYTDSTRATAIASTTALTSGTYYAVIKDPTTGCESATGLLVTVVVTTPGTPTLTTAGTQSFCSTAAPTFASILFNDTDIVWYTDSTRATAIASTTALTSGTYYAVIKDPTTGCESVTGLLVTVVVTTPGTPTLTTAGTQSFCSTAAPTFASILFNDTDIVWYTDSTRATAIASTTALTSGTYYAVIKDPTTGCESVTGLLVTVVVTTPGTPILTTAGTQSFCSTAAPTFASILFNDTDIVWYTDSTRATAIAPTTALTSGTYYAVIKDPTTGCESVTGLLVTVVVTTPGTPTLTTAGTQSFCSTAAPTFASILFNDTDIVWYTDSTRATAIASTTALTSGTYYAVIKDPTTGCESVTGLLVTVVVTTPGTPTLTTAGTQSFCSTAAPTFASILFNDTDIVWYTDSTRATAIASTTALTSGTYYAVIKDPTTGCESVTGLLVTVVVTTPGTPTLTTAGTQSFCSTAAPTFASILFNDTDIVWYTDSTRATAIASTTALTSGTYYAVIKDPTTGCESATGLLVTVVVTTPGTPTLTTAGTQSFCSTAAPTFASILFNDTDIVWYTDSTRATAIASTTALTSGTYYAVIKDPTTGCESVTGLLVTVVVTTPGTPTLTTAGTQSFCSTAAPTFASILFNDTDIVWYTDSTRATAIAPTTALTSGTYYAVIKDPTTGCESATGLLVTVTVTDPATPTTTDNTQDFCLVNAPKVSDLQVNESNVIWYKAGVQVGPTTALSNGVYAAVIKDPATGCESSVQLLVTVTVTDPATPTTTDNTQDFCLVNAPKVSDLQVNESNVIWYKAGVQVGPTTALSNGVYAAVIKDPATGCESSVQLLVTVTVTDPATPTTTDNTQDFCLVNAPKVSDLQVNESNVIWYKAGVQVGPTTALSNGVYAAVIKDPATGCESSVQLLVTVTVTDPATPTTTDNTQDFCLVNAPKVSDLQVNESNVIWYKAGVQVGPTTALSNGVYAAVIKDPLTGCESSAQLLVTVTVTDPATPTTADTTQDFCKVTNPTVANLQVNESNVIWYKGGVQVGLTTALSNGVYAGVIKDPLTGCDSSEQLLVTVTVTDPAKPTTNDTTQDFCLANAPKVSNLQVNEANVIWYKAGVQVGSTTALSNGVYAGVIKDPLTGCESSEQLLVTVTVTDPTKPTTNDTTQDFCLVNDSKVSDIQVNETGVIWYSTATGGTALAPTTSLVSGSYYGAIVDASTGCESSVRLLVTVSVTDGATATTRNATQAFCLVNAPKISDIQINEAGIVWYNVSTGGTALAPGTALVAGTYYAALKNPTTGCESKVRLAVVISFQGNEVVAISESKANPCVFDEVTYTTLAGMSNYNWTITGGTVTGGGTATDNFVTVKWPSIGAASVNISYTTQCNEIKSKLLNLSIKTCSDITMSMTVDNPNPSIGDNVTFTVTVNNVGSGSFIDTMVSDLLPTGYEFVSSDTTLGNYSNGTGAWSIPELKSGESAVLNIVVKVLPTGDYLNIASVLVSNPIDSDTTNNVASASVDPICLVVYNEFTPNNDGANDLFRIDCIENYPNNELKVFNRYGTMVYSKKHYENDWDGTANVSGVISKGDTLPTGTYFYVIEIGDGAVKKGWLSIIR